METKDLIVIGGGINGAGIAADAAGRGLSVLMLEAQDLACATSSASSKLIHGGLRYLEHYEFRLVSEALAEREVLLKMAPHKAIIEAARMRLRPILMTSLAFILGVLPLVISHGAGSGAQNAVGTGVMGGMFAATVLAIYFVPVFFVVVEHLFARFKKA